MKDRNYEQSLSHSLADALRTIRLRPLLTMRLAVRPLIVVGETPLTTRRIGVVFGGTFEGSRLASEVLDGGSDWQSVRRDGATLLDVRLTLRTDDGALIGITYISGPLAGPGESEVLGKVTVNIGRIFGGMSPNRIRVDVDSHRPSLKRRLVLVARQRELGPLPGRMATLCREILDTPLISG